MILVIKVDWCRVTEYFSIKEYTNGIQVDILSINPSNVQFITGSTVVSNIKLSTKCKILKIMDYTGGEVINILLAGEQGFEPRSATLKAAVLPLNHSPLHFP